MKINNQNNKGSASGILCSCLLAVLLFVSCTDEYLYETTSPDFLEGSIYSYLNEDGNFTNYVKLIEDLDYKEVLDRTGSKTIFAPTDSAFNEFYKSNVWNVSSYEDLSLSQKKQLFYFSMINNAYTLEKMSNYFDGTSVKEGSAMRRKTALSPIDSIPFETDLPLNNTYWDKYRNRGLYLLKDNSDITLVFFSQQFIDKNNVTSTDFEFLTGRNDRKSGDFYIFDRKVTGKGAVCQNGYVYPVDGVLIPPVNMAEYIADNSRTSVFSVLLDRFSVPVYDDANTKLYKELYPGFTDSIFNKSYFAVKGGTIYDPSGVEFPNKLSFNPGWNAYVGSSLYSDVAAMFVPTDEAMNDYFNNDPSGQLLKERYGSWENLPLDVASSFLKRHMRVSMVESLPSRFGTMVDEQNYRLPVSTSDILTDYNYTAINGEVYLTNKVYTPVDFISVYGPVLLSEGTKVMNWAINRTETANDGTQFAFYNLYLNSLVAKYALFVPTDEYLDKYIDPVAFGQDGTQGVLKYWYNTKTETVNATVYKYSKSSDLIGDSVGVITTEAFIQNRLWKLLDSHIVIGDLSSGDGYYITKANDIIKVSDGGQKIQGGFDIEKGTSAGVIRQFNQDNGTTYTLNSPIQGALQSVYSVLSDAQKSDFSSFFELLEGIPTNVSYASELQEIFTQRGMDFCISFFNAYHYTIYAPSNNAIANAQNAGIIKSWSQIEMITDMTQQREEALNLVRFLRYHFQDRAVFVGSVVNDIYDSSTIKQSGDNFPSYWGTTTNKYYKLGVVGDGTKLTLTTEKGTSVDVTYRAGYTNIIAKDFVFNDTKKTSADYKNVDGTGATTAAAFNTSRITTSSSAVIHLIEDVLTFK